MIALLLGVFLKKPALKKRMLLTGIFMLLFFSNPWFANKAISAWEITPVAGSSLNGIYDVGIVLGGSMRYYDNTTKRVVYSSSVDRLIQAIDLYHQGKIKKILLSGGSGYVSYPEWKESVFLEKVLQQCNIPQENIITEINSRNTRENAVEATAILKDGKYGTRFLLITSATHMRRSLACFKKAGLTTDPYSVDARSGVEMYTPDKLLKPDSENISNWDILIHEWLGMLMYRIAGYI